MEKYDIRDVDLFGYKIVTVRFITDYGKIRKSLCYK